MRVLFVFSSNNFFSVRKPLYDASEIHLGIAYLSAFLKQNGHETDLYVCTRKTSLARMDAYVQSSRPDVVAFSGAFCEYALMVELAARLRESFPSAFRVIGGVHATLNPESCIQDPFDAVCEGEGERALNELCNQLREGRRPEAIPGLWFRRGGEVEHNAPEPFMDALDELPFPDRHMWEPWLASDAAPPSVLLSRGCPFNCTYCCNHALKRVADGPYVRHRSPGNIVAEIDALVREDPGIGRINLLVESFTVDIPWALALCRVLEEYNERRADALAFQTNVRIVPNADPEALLSAMGRANFTNVSIGLESGSERIRSEVLNRHYGNETVERWVDATRANGIKVSFFNLVGVPGETREDFQETIAINRKCLPDSQLLSIFSPYPGTVLHQRAVEGGLIPDDFDTENERCRANLDLPGFSRREIEQAYVWFDYCVYRGHRPLWKLLARVVAFKMKTRPFTGRVYRLVRHVLGSPGLRRIRQSLLRL
jgi:radical SAM superfamily enzyme YgiQ (UPF0313 family)